MKTFIVFSNYGPLSNKDVVVAERFAVEGHLYFFDESGKTVAVFRNWSTVMVKEPE